MVNMAGQQQQYPSRYPNLLVTVKHETDERSASETYSNPRMRRSKDNYRPSSFQAKNVYYNSNHRHHNHHQQPPYFTRPSHTSPRSQQQSFYPTYDRLHYQYPHQPIRPLMEIKDNLFSLHHDEFDNNDDDNNDNDDVLDDDDDDKNITYCISKQREPRQRGQYRNRKAELDWDHAFDLDLVDLYSIHPDPDTRSLISTISSSDHSFSSM
jgi:hypothetical protein